MTHKDLPIVDIELEPRMEREKAQAFFAGELDHKDREVWVWLPFSIVEIEKDGKRVIVSMPEWLAKDKGLI